MSSVNEIGLFKRLFFFVQTTYTTCFVLYHLAKNPDVQQKLHQETCNILPDGSAELNEANFLNKASYAKAVLKESLRLNPISIGVGRKLNNDLVLSGYNVPRGVSLQFKRSDTQSHAKCLQFFNRRKW